MDFGDFKLEREFALHEFSAQHLLGVSDCETFSVEEILSEQELQGLRRLRLGYTTTKGSLGLREQVSGLFEKISARDILICAPSEGIFLAMNSLLAQGDRVVVQVPCYQSLSEVPKALGCEVVKWSPRPDEKRAGGFYWDIGDLVSLVEQGKTKLISVNSPQNPTGDIFSRQEFGQIVDIARRKNCHVFSDEMYRFSEHDERDRLPSGCELYEKCVSLGGLSKSFGLPGLRVGWLSAQGGFSRGLKVSKEPSGEGILRRVQRYKDYTTICPSALSEQVAIAALRKKDELLRRNLGIIKENLTRLDAFFSQYQDVFSWDRPKAGPVAFVELKTRRGSKYICDDALEEVGVMLVSSQLFDYGDRHIRFGFGRKNMPEALQAFEGYVGRYRDRL